MNGKTESPPVFVDTEFTAVESPVSFASKHPVDIKNEISKIDILLITNQSPVQFVNLTDRL